MELPPFKVKTKGRPLIIKKARLDESEGKRLNRLRQRKCKRGHSRAGSNGIVQYDYRTGAVRLICRTCLNLRQKKYYADGKPYRYK